MRIRKTDAEYYAESNLGIGYFEEPGELEGNYQKAKGCQGMDRLTL
jgi:hypothetical protein